MEDSTHSSMIRALSSKDPTPSSEESGWTMYFDDFMPSGNEESSASPSGCHRGSSSSLVSDAASYAAWKLQGSAKPSMAPAASFKKLSFKKRKTGAVLEDDSLEDTASSPVNSPKVIDLKQLDINPCKKDGDIDSCEEKEVSRGDCPEPTTDERNELCYAGNDCTELKKRGLCLVPLSVLVNYLE
ncbi:hypothetical protein AAC387_Pa07g2191 [Persea americana]|eukprot:TRINITY_DN25894_c0_g2_i1.p1 TRINITY_DN25894_c0_g2~~TRINITY_DN25894_c0_g2_i1.p1  ORF type:complete len:214 (+),score=58.50 TRINITY_DN25894_c0_g2_i1:90-644(+)